MKKILFIISLVLLIFGCEKTKEYVVDKNKCTDCGKCRKTCPNDMIEREINYIDGPDTFYVARIRTNRCVGCGECQKACLQNNGTENCAIEELKH